MFFQCEGNIRYVRGKMFPFYLSIFAVASAASHLRFAVRHWQA